MTDSLLAFLIDLLSIKSLKNRFIDRLISRSSSIGRLVVDPAPPPYSAAIGDILIDWKLLDLLIDRLIDWLIRPVYRNGDVPREVYLLRVYNAVLQADAEQKTYNEGQHSVLLCTIVY